MTTVIHKMSTPSPSSLACLFGFLGAHGSAEDCPGPAEHLRARRVPRFPSLGSGRRDDLLGVLVVVATAESVCALLHEEEERARRGLLSRPHRQY